MNHASVKRGTIKSDEEIKKEQEFSNRVTLALKTFFTVRNSWKESGKTIDELLSYSQKLMELLSEHPTVVNFREDLITEKISTIINKLMQQKLTPPEQQIEAETQPEAESKEPEKSPIDELIEFFKNEMMFLVKLAMKDPKCYQLWFHRKWLLSKLWEIESTLPKSTGEMTRQFLEGDLKICDKFLAKDERNFHAWNYRCFIVYFAMERFQKDRLMIIDRELDFIAQKLNANFSNYSAIHFKTKYTILRQKILDADESIADELVVLPIQILQKELKFVWDGLYIVPFEQSLWIYLDWILHMHRIIRIWKWETETTDSGSKIMKIQLNMIIPQNYLRITALGAEEIVTEYTLDGTVLSINLPDSFQGKIVLSTTPDFPSKKYILPTTTIEGDVLTTEPPSEIETAVLQLWSSTLIKMIELKEIESDKKEVVLQYCSLEAEYTSLNESFEILTKKKDEIKREINELKNRLGTTHPLLDATWDGIDRIYCNKIN